MKMKTLISLAVLLSPLSAAFAQQNTNEIYGAQYMECLAEARQRTQYVHESIREQAMGEMLNGCMYAKGWQQFAPVDEVEDKQQRLMMMNNGY
ncbi:MAG: hypothetical protein EB060_03590 [Proteobacteria bacterium]|nr:hypothetical protein [Pseudomonadota bacterium]